nr:PEP-CTERM sorting domain-containing protein [Trichocoleus sp. FACHB-90]
MVAPATGGQVVVPGDGNGVSVPEPTTLLGLVAVGLGLTRLKRRRAN